MAQNTDAMKLLPERMLQTIARARALIGGRARVDLRGSDVEMLQIMALGSGDPERIRRVLDIANPLSPAVAAHAIPLLGSQRLAGDAIRALRQVAEPNAGKLLDRLLDTAQPIAVRRRIPRVLSACSSPRVVDGLLLGVGSAEPDVAAQCARALLLIMQRQPDIRLDKEVIVRAVQRELLSQPPSLGIIFTLLTLLLPPPAVRTAYRAVKGSDPHLRGTAQEYLRGVLPLGIRDDVLRTIAR